MMKNRKWKEILPYVIVITIPFFVAYYCLRGYQIDYSVLPGIGGDGTLFAALLKSVKQYGLIGTYFNPMIGAPESASLIDVPFLDIMLLLEVWVCAIAGMNFISIYYAIYYLTFIIAGVSMLFLLKKLGVKDIPACVLSIAFSLAPYHFYRGLGHVTLSNYGAVPLGIYLAINIFFGKYEEKKQCLRDIALALIVGFSNIYYVFFSLLLMALAMVLRCIQLSSIKKTLKNAIPIGVSIVAFLLGVFPKIIYGVLEGTNTVAGRRLGMEAELYGLKIIELLMPSQFSILERKFGFTGLYTTSGVSVSENVMSPLGVIASVGFIISMVWLIIILAEKKERIANLASSDKEVLSFVSIGILALILYCTVGGFGTIFNYLITPQFRCYNRASIVIACLSLCSLAILLNYISGPVLQIAVAMVLLLIICVDQIYILPSSWQTPIEEKQRVYESFFEELEDKLNSQDMVYEIPHIPFPEAPPIHQMTDYTPFLGYLFTDNIRWSYGGVRGRENVATDLWVDEGQSESFLANLKKNGFSGALIDTYAFDEEGQKAILDFYNGSESCQYILKSEDERFFFYILQ